MKEATYQLNFSKKAVDTALPSEQVDSAPKSKLGYQALQKKSDVTAEEPSSSAKRRSQAKSNLRKKTEDVVETKTNPAPAVSGQDRDAR